MPRQMPSTGTPASARSRSSSTSPSARSRRIASGNAPTPGSTIASAAAIVVAVGRARDASRRRARAPSRRCAGCPSRSRRARRSRQRPLGRRHAGLVGVDRHRDAQRAGERLEARLDHVVRVRAGLQLEVQRQPRRARHGAEELLGRLVLEAGDRARRAARARSRSSTAGRRCRSRTPRAPRPSARPRARSGGSRAGRRAPRRAPGRARCRCPRPCGARRSRGRPGPCTVEAEPAVAREQVEHVVEEADAGARSRPARLPSRSRRDLHVGLAGLPAQLCGAAHRVRDSGGSGRTSTRRARRSPRPRRPGTPARASAAAAGPTRTSLMRRRKCATLSPDAKRAAPSVGSVWFEPAT